ncbi:MAG: ABC transporter permease [Hyphomonas sp.]|nr:ABC transporter permease [Hyphomonas sp.]MCB9961538.1 ABC transporter permease [Hyphomonas sp.]MCB9971714.1 ABC transporter permease [Hyphomonas sp.]
MSQAAAPFGKLERTLAWRYLRAKREHGGASLISIISFIGIFFAVAALIITMSIMSGFRATLLDALLGGQPHIYGVVSSFTEEEADAIAKKIEALPDVLSARPYIEEYVLVAANGRKTGAAVRALRPEDLKTMPFLKDGGAAAIEAGFGEGKNGGNVIMMGSFLAAGRDGLGVRPGDKVEIVTVQANNTVVGATPRSKTYTVGDIFETGSVELDALYIFMPMDQAQVLFQSKDHYQMLDIRLKDPDKTHEAMKAISEATGNGLYIFDWKSQRAAYFNALKVERTMVRLLVMVIMGIATLNIIVGVVMLVKNKTRDIAILRTMGLGRGGVLRVFLMVGTVLGTLGAALGMLVGVLFVLNIGAVEAFINFFMDGQKVFDAETYGLSHLPAILDWGDVFSTGLYALLMSAGVSIIPAWWASRQDPVSALRFE